MSERPASFPDPEPPEGLGRLSQPKAHIAECSRMFAVTARIPPIAEPRRIRPNFTNDKEPERI